MPTTDRDTLREIERGRQHSRCH